MARNPQPPKLSAAKNSPLNPKRIELFSRNPPDVLEEEPLES
jgi:hypothetical protein